MLLGVLIFIDDYFNCLTVGAVMRPVTESHKISRAKLAYSSTPPPPRVHAGSRVLLGRRRCLLCARWLPRLPHQHVPEPDSLELLLHPDPDHGHRHLRPEH